MSYQNLSSDSGGNSPTHTFFLYFYRNLKPARRHHSHLQPPTPASQFHSVQNLQMMRLTDFRKLNSSIETLGHQFLQRCSVSGTAKGKGKLKAGQTLKRSKVSTKKGMILPVRADKSRGPRRSELEQIIDDCLRSSAPVRILKPKDREREAKREKMGLLSEARKLEIQKLKKQQKMDNTLSIIGTPGLDLISLGMVDDDKIPKYELTVEDGCKLAKEYSRVLMRKHRARQAVETNLLKCKKEAIEVLPENLKAAALVPDYSPFPIHRFMASWTPPIEGYMIKEASKRNAGKQKLR